MWRLTLARLNSAMNFLIYSTKMQEFKDSYIGIFRQQNYFRRELVMKKVIFN